MKRDDDTYDAAKVLQQPLNHENEPYTVQLSSSGDILQVMSQEISDINPNPPPVPDSTINGMVPWLIHDAKITIFLPQFQH